jgi:hypothetical protein
VESGQNNGKPTTSSLIDTGDKEFEKAVRSLLLDKKE